MIELDQGLNASVLMVALSLLGDELHANKYVLKYSQLLWSKYLIYVVNLLLLLMRSVSLSPLPISSQSQGKPVPAVTHIVPNE